MINYGWSDVYSKTRGKLFIKFPLKFYTITPWIQDILELPMTLGGKDPVKLNTKNNFYIGLDNTFSIDKVMNIGLNFDFRIGSSLGTNPLTGITDDLELRLTPTILLNGEYDIGFKWGISQSFEMFYYPNISNGTLQFTDMEGTYLMAFELLHFAKSEKIKMSLYAEMYLWARLLNAGKNNENYYGNYHLMKSLDPAAGLTFDFYCFTPFLLFFYHAFGTAEEFKLTGSWVGIKSGLGYCKDWFTLAVTYYGTINSDPKADGEWQNHIETSITFSL